MSDKDEKSYNPDQPGVRRPRRSNPMPGRPGWSPPPDEREQEEQKRGEQ